ncbi:DNA-methyltransferase [Lysinibacillus antri]|uniref:Methyltransferase n=1 Tax=Lysinibacillus antri TaxID=2498145 RepID=A0A3S0R433_9BACI|nr:site-specific DNA-methyltransferase [Lysinibacillus antri]RUL47231.1 site-specific DNA-methyltransferase [Lysinibacillus antri]
MTRNNNPNMATFNQYLTCNSIRFRDYLPQVTEPFIDLIVTSPPYWDMKQYGEVEQTGFKQTYEEYLDDIEQTFATLYDLSKDTATLYVNSDTIKRDGKIIRLPDDIAKRLESIGWIHKDILIWDKGKTLPWSHKGQMRNTFEYIHMFVKSEDYKYYIERIKTVDELKEWWVDYPERYSPEGKVPDNIWEFTIPTQGSWGTKKDFGDKEFKHACPFPPEMMARLIKLSSDEGDVVFDPYAGTGILLATAENLNRKYMGLDTNPGYKEIFEHVTKPLIKEQIVNINQYYEYQENLKRLLNEAIYKLRILKFPKAMIKTFIREQNQSFPFVCAFAIEERYQLTDNERANKKIGKASYYFILNPHSNNNDNTYTILKEMSENAPFSKYGLIHDIHLITMEEAIQLFQEQNEEIYLYVNAIVNNSISSISFDEYLELIQNEVLIEKYCNKGIPPIFSNVNITLSDYEEILPDKFKRNG